MISIKGAKAPCQQAHDALFNAIRNDKPYNVAERGAKSSMTSILGRMATYSGKVIEWEAAINSQLSVMPKEYDMQAEPPTKPDADGWYAHAVPGKTVVI